MFEPKLFTYYFLLETYMKVPGNPVKSSFEKLKTKEFEVSIPFCVFLKSGQTQLDPK